MVVFQQCYVSVLYMYPEWLRSYGCMSTEVRLILVAICFLLFTCDYVITQRFFLESHRIHKLSLRIY